MVFQEEIIEIKNKMQGVWNEARGTVQRRWGKLTDNDIHQIQGKFDVMVGKLQQRYGYSKEGAQNMVSYFFRKYPHLPIL